MRGNAQIKEVNLRIPLELPEGSSYTTIAGFFLNEFGKIPKEGDELRFRGYQFVVDKMNKRHISLIRIIHHATKVKDEDRR